MINLKSIAAALLGLALCALPAVAQENAHAAPEIAKQSWSFGGLFGTYDRNQVQRGFQVFEGICSGCHSARLLSFRNLSEPGGPEFSEEQVKALAATYTIADASAEGGSRAGVPADHWPTPFTEAEARDTFGVVPPDFSVIAKARGTTQSFPWWILNYFTVYSEGGPDYIYALMHGYQDPPPEGVEVPPGKYYNAYFPGHAIGMSPPLYDGAIEYEDETFPRTIDQYSRDISAFLMWLAEPHLVARKEAGLRVILFLVLLAGLMWFVKQRLWAGVPHHNPAPAQAAVAAEAPPPKSARARRKAAE